jgi:hypothetical protein
MRMSVGVALVAVVLASGCKSTNAVSMTAASALRHGGHRDLFTIGDAKVGPNSELKFCHVQHGCSDWIEASDLRVDESGVWVDRSSSYGWDEVSRIEIKGQDGLKTTAAIVGVAAVAVIVIPILLVAAYMKALPKDGPPTDSNDGTRVAAAAVAIAGVAAEVATQPEPVDVDPYWGATLRSRAEQSVGASRLFTLGARVRSVATVGAFLDSSVATTGDLVTSGAIARLRLASFIEAGVGARIARTKGERGWERARMFVAQGGFHNQVTARIALPLGVDVAWGDGALEREIRIPWGIRYTARGGRWTGTLQPVTPSYAKRADADGGRWSISVGLELGVTL